ncbi:hypothetical protein P154DRAFT_624134 [Amniculicola lignicola CBS 123094]|uniref:Uncharacterized protein n=1 Tax=Amniculicola lignicola CBS 123094 TaxID=1392246 RepID=A0A6A5W0H6_9PLEO|nr:hypothetical protein P154DRAFT_624134 [Amniculicola lignicola CBS 123094]
MQIGGDTDMDAEGYSIELEIGAMSAFDDVLRIWSGYVVQEANRRILAHGSDVGVQQKAPEISLNDSSLPTAQERFVLENASLQGAAKVFDGYMCNAIRRVTVRSDIKAAITMVFPGWGGPVDCLMSLDVCEWDIA